MIIITIINIVVPKPKSISLAVGKPRLGNVFVGSVLSTIAKTHVSCNVSKHSQTLQEMHQILNHIGGSQNSATPKTRLK